jgi:response regulator RpfG family c-di-GMP phosphodiesterase|tara:strand:+ start:150 stop:629 length:480 start_codon:yes stop_codon:yes gene_type:complete
MAVKKNVRALRRWLRDPEKCNRDEMKLIEQHPIHAAEMPKPYPMFKEAELIIRAHHEDWNGKGYPNRLKGESIPFEARLLHLALDFCSKHADPIQAMLDIEELSGDLYDPDAVRAIAKAVPLTEMPERALDSQALGLHHSRPFYRINNGQTRNQNQGRG